MKGLARFSLKVVKFCLLFFSSLRVAAVGAVERLVRGMLVQNVLAEVVLVYAGHIAHGTLPFVY